MKTILDLMGVKDIPLNMGRGSVPAIGRPLRPADGASLRDRIQFYLENLDRQLAKTGFSPHDVVEMQHGAQEIMAQIEDLFRGICGGRRIAGGQYKGQMEQFWFDTLVAAGIGNAKKAWTKKFTLLAEKVANYEPPARSRSKRRGASYQTSASYA